MKVRPQERDQVIRVERLSQEAAASAGSWALRRHVVVTGDEYDGRNRSVGCEAVSKLEAAHLTEVNVEHDAFGLAADGAGKEFFRRAKRLYRDAVSAKHSRESGANRFIIIDDADPEVMSACGARHADIGGSCHDSPPAGASLMIRRLASSTPLDFGPTCPVREADGPPLEAGLSGRHALTSAAPIARTDLHARVDF